MGVIHRLLDFSALKIFKLSLSLNCTDMLLAIAIEPTHLTYEQDELLLFSHQISHNVMQLSQSLFLILYPKSPYVLTLPFMFCFYMVFSWISERTKCVLNYNL